ncbi:zinc ribbon domain-containing protein [Cystobacter fuscus]
MLMPLPSRHDGLGRALTNYQQPDQRGAAREGSALLQGLVLCGRCGHRMQTSYREPARPYYECRRFTDKGICWTVSARGIDEAVAHLFLETVQPPEIELGLAITREVEHQAQEVERQWRLRLERARYEAQLAERRYKAVDPDNRVVARTLEREWNQKLGELESLEREHQQVLRREKVELTSQDRARLLELAKDLSYVWHARSTTNAERKNLLRILVREVVLSPVDVPERGIHIQLLWQTGTCSELSIARRPSSERATSPEVIELIGTLAKERSDREVAAELNRRGCSLESSAPGTRRRCAGCASATASGASPRDDEDGHDSQSAGPTASTPCRGSPRCWA